MKLFNTLFTAFGLTLTITTVAYSQAGGGQIAAQKEQPDSQQQLQGNRTVLGKVLSVTSQQVKVDIGEVQPRFLPLKPAQEKKFPEIKEGEDLIITVNDQNLIVDYHLIDQAEGTHKVVRGEIAQNLPIGQDKVVVKDEGGQDRSFEWGQHLGMALDAAGFPD